MDILTDVITFNLEDNGEPIDGEIYISIDDVLDKLEDTNGISNVEIRVKDSDKKLIFKLKNKRKIERKSINLIKNRRITAIIN